MMDKNETEDFDWLKDILSMPFKPTPVTHSEPEVFFTESTPQEQAQVEVWKLEDKYRAIGRDK